jgi:hypothetical protein
MAKKKLVPTFEIRFVGPAITPETIPFRAVSDALSAVQDLASGRDPFETASVPSERSIRLVNVRRGSAVYGCVSHAPDEARTNLIHVATLLSPTHDQDAEGDGLVAALRPIESLSMVARSIQCHVEIALANHDDSPLFVIGEGDFQHLSDRLLLAGETTVVGEVKRVGGATKMRCVLSVPGRHRLLYCDVESGELVRKLGQHLYEEIAATGTAIWIHRSWRIYRFTVKGFTQPRIGNPSKAMEELRDAGLKAWDQISDPAAFIRELRS